MSSTQPFNSVNIIKLCIPMTSMTEMYPKMYLMDKIKKYFHVGKIWLSTKTQKQKQKQCTM